MNAVQLISDWRDGKIGYGEQVRLTNLILAKSDECWLPPNRPPKCDCPERDYSVQVVGNIEMLFENMPPMFGGDIMHWHEEAVIEGKVCPPTIAGYPLAVTDISHLSAMSELGIQFVSGLGKEGLQSRVVAIEYDAETGKLRANETECDDE